MPQNLNYRLAAAGDRPAVERLLRSAGLPCEDLAASGVVLLVAASDQEVLACVGIEPRGRQGLIRSLVVAQAARGQGWGTALAQGAESLAAANGLSTLYLLTNTAEKFWTRRGYRVVARDEVPAAIQASAEFASLCPSSATCMVLDLGAEGAALKPPVEQRSPAGAAAATPRAKAEALFSQGYYCAESVLQALAPDGPGAAPFPPRAATAFCSGMARTRGTCGAVTGAILGLSLTLGRDTPQASVQQCYEATQRFLTEFERRFGSSNCQTLLEGCDLATVEGQAMFKERAFSQRCREYSGTAAELAAAEIRASSRA